MTGKVGCELAQTCLPGQYAHDVADKPALASISLFSKVVQCASRTTGICARSATGLQGLLKHVDQR